MRAIITLDAPVHNVVHLLLWRARESWPQSYIESDDEAIGLGVLKFPAEGFIHLGFVVEQPSAEQPIVMFSYKSDELLLSGTEEVIKVFVNYPNWSGRVTCS